MASKVNAGMKTQQPVYEWLNTYGEERTKLMTACLKRLWA